MQYWYFFKWVFNFSNWESYSIRYLLYVIVALVGMFFTPWAPMLMLLAFSFEIMGDLVFNRWKEFQKEQSAIARQLKKNTKSTYKNRVK
tara:strand:+ start:490 stop:756 length:267 start_codon:yes stop_codon:yes gene_type:complete